MDKETATTQGIFDTEELAEKAKTLIQAYSIGLYKEPQIIARAVYYGMNKDQTDFIKSEMLQIDERRATITQKITQDTKRENKTAANFNNDFNAYFSKYPRPLPLIPKLTNDEAEKAVYSPGKARAEFVCEQITAVSRNIQIISERKNAGCIFLKKYGEDFNSTENKYIPTWSVKHFKNIIKEESDRRLFFYIMLYGETEDTTAKQDALKEAFPEIRDFRKRAISELRKFPESLDAFYNSAYAQAYTIAQALPVKYQPKGKAVYTITELALLCFFCTFNVTPDANADKITEKEACYIKNLVYKIDRFFCTYANKEEKNYDIFIDFLYNEITNNAPDLSGLVSKPGHLYFPINAKYNYFPNLKEYEKIFPGFNSEFAERFMLTCWPYYEKARLLGFSEEAIISIKSAELIESILGKQKGSGKNAINSETGKKWEKGEKAQEWRGQIAPTIDALETIYTPITTENTRDKYRLLVAWGIHEETGIVDFKSPWMIERSKAIHAIAKKSRQGKEINPFITIIRDVTKETPLVRELTAAILSEAMNGVRFKKCSHNPARLIREKCPRLYVAINEKATGKEKTLLLKRVYERFYKILEMPQKIAFYDYFLPITQDENGNKIKSVAPYFVMIDTKTGKTIKSTEKVKTITKTIATKDEKTGKKITIKEKGQVITRANPCPTFKNWGDVTIILYHGGKNSKYQKPI